MARFAWVPGLIGAALTAFFVLRVVMIGTVDERALVVAVGAALGLLAYAWLDEGAKREAGVLRLSTGAFALAAMTVAGSVSAYAVARSFDHAWDFTSQGTYSLSDHSRAVLGKLPADVTVIGFFPYGSADAHRFELRGAELSSASPRITVQSADKLRDPLLAQRFGVDSLPMAMVISRGDRFEVLGQRRDEVSVVNAIARVASDAQHVVCWSIGHGEASADGDQDPRSDAAAVLALEGTNVQVLEIELLSGVIPPACEAIVLAGPVTDLTRPELDLLAGHVARGGRLMLLLEPGRSASLVADLGRYGVTAGEGVIVDPDPKRQLGQVDVPVVMVFPQDAWRPSPITEGVGGAVVLGVARSIVPIDGRAGLRAHGLLFTSGQAWSELSPPGTAPAKDAGEAAGEQPVIVAVEVDDGAVVAPDPAAKSGGRVLIVGDASFITNELVTYASNQELFLSGVTWLLGEDDLLADRTDPAAAPLEMTAWERVIGLFLCLVLAPGVPAILAIQRWWARRRG